jgi:hypothetical protein
MWLSESNSSDLTHCFKFRKHGAVWGAKKRRQGKRKCPAILICLLHWIAVLSTLCLQGFRYKAQCTHVLAHWHSLPGHVWTVPSWGFITGWNRWIVWGFNVISLLPGALGNDLLSQDFILTSELNIWTLSVLRSCPGRIAPLSSVKTNLNYSL